MRNGGQGQVPNGNSSQQPAAAPTINLPEGAAKSMGKAVEGEEDVEAEVCFICASPVVHNSIAPCNHRTCHICALRMRALYKTKTCAHCRTPADLVIFTDDATKRYEDFVPSDFSQKDDNLGICYENPEIFEDTVLLLRYNCPDPGCDVACLGWPDLHRHVRTVHHEVMCDLCTRNKKVFTHEHELFTKEELKKHEKFGDDNPGAIDQSGFKGHPECGFCRIRFYGDDELFAHCRDKHERCHVCDRRNGGLRPQYYVDYNALEVHFRKDHFMCPDAECLEKKFVVFDSEIDLKAHQLEAHPNGLTKETRRDARRIDMAGFDYRSPHTEERPRREGRGRGGRGRDPNAEPLPASSAQPMTRAELAYQRTMAIQSAQSVTPRSFGGSLTQPDAYAARPPPNAREPATVTAHPSTNREAAMPSVGSLSLAPPPGSSGPTTRSTSPAAPLTPQEQARQLRHSAVTERASNMLGNDQGKLGDFRNKVSAYRSGAIKAPALIDGFFSLFDTSSGELGKLVKELAEIFEITSKRDELLKAWSDWKAINEDYPSLPGPSGASSSTSTWGHNLGGSRVLKLKSSTAQSSRSAAHRQGSFGGAAFPPIQSASRAGNPKPASATPWVSGASSLANSARASPAPTQSQSTARPPPRADMFPALPPGKKPTSTVFSPGYTGAGIRRPISTTPSFNPWGGGATSPPTEPVEDPVPGPEAQGGKKKGKGKKQILYNWG